jgi:hypothetical protein
LSATSRGPTTASPCPGQIPRLRPPQPPHTAPKPAGSSGTKDKDYNLIRYIEACLSNAPRTETCIQDAERENDSLAELFRRAQADSRKGAEPGKRLLRARLGD